MQEKQQNSIQGQHIAAPGNVDVPPSGSADVKRMPPPRSASISTSTASATSTKLQPSPASNQASSHSISTPSSARAQKQQKVTDAAEPEKELGVLAQPFDLPRPLPPIRSMEDVIELFDMYKTKRYLSGWLYRKVGIVL
jgi:hypothetical protein